MVSAKERMKKYRERMKNDPEKDHEIKLKDKMRKRHEREKLKVRKKEDKEFQEKERERKRLEMQRYRKRKADEKNNEHSVDKRSKGGASVQKAVKQKQQKKEYKKKVQDNTAKKREAVIRTQKWRMRVKLKTTPSQEKDKEGKQNTNEDPFPSRWPKYRAVKRVKSTLPSTPRKRVVQELANSPSCKKILDQEDSICSPQLKLKAQIGECLLTSLSDLNKETLAIKKNSKNIDKRGIAHARKILRSILKKGSKIRGLQTKVEKQTGLRKFSKKSISQDQKESVHLSCISRKARKDKLSDDLKKKIKEFYTSGEVSKCKPNKKDVSKKRNVPKFAMTMTIRDAYCLFKKKNPSAEVGFIAFFKLKPKNVKKVSETNRRCCMCQICCNVALKCEAANNFMIGKSNTAQPLTKKDASNLTVCKYEGEYADASCIKQECQNCGTKLLKEYFERHLDLNKHGKAEINYHRWESILVNGKETQKRCVSCVSKTSDFNIFIDDFVKDLSQLPGHLFRASWQIRQLEIIKEKLPENEAVVIMDFAENYTCTFQNEVQSAFWDSNQVTIHPIMTYYQVKINDEEYAQRKHSFIFISNDLKHDARAVHEFREKLYDKLADECPDVNVFHEWTDGCASQYKGKCSFADISRDERTIERNFFKTSHGKNVCDGLGATVKNVCHQAVISGRKVISNAEDLYEFCKEKLSVNTPEVKRDIIYVDSKNIVRERPEVEVDTLVGTRKLHSVKNCNSALSLYVRNLSCLCDDCCSGNPCDVKYVRPWEHKTLKLTTNTGEKNTLDPAGPNDDKPQKKQQKKRGVGKSKSKSSARNEPNSSSSHGDGSVSLDQLQPGVFDSVMLSGKKSKKTFFGQITDIDKTTKEAHISYMICRQSLYMWPDLADVSWESVENIHQVLPAPVLAPISTNDRQFFPNRTID